MKKGKAFTLLGLHQLFFSDRVGKKYLLVSTKQGTWYLTVKGQVRVDSSLLLLSVSAGCRKYHFQSVHAHLGLTFLCMAYSNKEYTCCLPIYCFTTFLKGLQTHSPIQPRTHCTSWCQLSCRTLSPTYNHEINVGFNVLSKDTSIRLGKVGPEPAIFQLP